MPIYNKGRFKLSEIIQPQFGNNWPTAQVTTTSDVIEVASNLYFTNARVYSNVLALLPALAGSGIAIQANGQISANAAVVTFGSISQYLTTSNISEGSNLYYTNARVYSNVTAALAGNITVGTVSATGQIVSTAPGSTTTGAGQIYLNGSTLNRIDYSQTGLGAPTINTRSAGTKIVLYPGVDATGVDYGIGIETGAIWQSIHDSAASFKWYANTTPIAVLSGAGALTVSNIQANVWTGLYTANVIESNSNLYYTNARVYSNVIALLPTLAGSGISIAANGQISSNTSGTGTVSLTGLTTSNLNEGGNLYYTNARVASNVIGLLPSLAGSGILIQANGQINANVSTVLITNNDVIPVTQGNTAYTLSRVVTDPKAILVINEGLIQIPTTDYTVSGTTLTTTTQYPVGSNIEVRYFGTVSSQYSPTLSSLVNNFTGDGSNVNYTLSSSPVSSAYTIVNVDGVFQLVNTYSVNGSILSFTEAPAVGANIEIRVLSGTVTSSTSTSSTSTSTNSRILGYNLVFGG